MALRIVGIGLVPRDISVRGLEAARGCDRIFLDGYTSVQVEDGLADLLGRPVEVLDRGSVESDMLVGLATGQDVCLLVPGDGLTATTHHTLLVDCAERGVAVDVVPGISIATVVPGLLGLQWYKFGRPTTVPFPKEGYRPDSPHSVVAANLAAGLHTLVLMDIDAGRMMTAAEALRYLEAVDREKGTGAISGDTVVAAVARAGAADQVAIAGPLWRVVSEDIGQPPHAVVMLGPLHFMEEEALRRFWLV